MKIIPYLRLLALGCALTGLTMAAVAQQSPSSKPASPEAQQQQQAPQATPSSNPNDQAAQTFRGTIVKSQGSLVLKDTANNTSYQLDDQEKVKQFEGKSVSIRGTLDSATNIIHISSVQPTS